MSAGALGQGRGPVGLLAGWGRLPIVFATKARQTGVPLYCVGLRGEASPELADLVDSFAWCGPLRLGRMIRLFRRAGVRRVVMAGKVSKAKYLYRPWRLLRLIPDLRVVRAWYFRPRCDNRDDTLLLALVDEFARDGIAFDSALTYCPELFVRPGTLTRRGPSAAELTDIEFGWGVAKKMGELDVGQSVAVKDRAVIAVEAIEGTDRAIARAGELCRSGGFVVVKVAKPQQDMRFDVPTVGCSTIETLHRSRGRVLAIEAGKTIVIDKEQTVALADRYGISIVVREDRPGA
jgi:DUF1009 family protein